VKSLALWAALLCGSAEAQTVLDALSPESESNFEKFEFQIPMRDGVRLYTAVYVPKEASAPYPILLYRTRYGVGPRSPSPSRFAQGVTPSRREGSWPASECLLDESSRF
jgi:predicted acyl esterase